MNDSNITVLKKALQALSYEELKEEITEGGVLTFTQTGIVGTVIHRSPDRKPTPPWNL